MPGHPIAVLEQEQMHQSFNRLQELIASHDVVYALTDSREARWLPTVLCAQMDKMFINSALGFDSYLVMRHGGSTDWCDPSSRPGCYFCTDVVAPTDRYNVLYLFKLSYNAQSTPIS